MWDNQWSRNDIPTWLNLGVNVIILILTVEIVRLNRLNVYLNSRNVYLNTLNVENNQASAKSGEQMLEELKQINQKIEMEKC